MGSPVSRLRPGILATKVSPGRNLKNPGAYLLLSFPRRRMAPSPALTGISRVTLGHREELAIQRMSDTARLRRHAHAEQDSLEQSAA